MKKITNYIKENPQDIALFATLFFLLAGVFQYMIGWTYVLRLTPLVIGIITALVIIFWGIKPDIRLKASLAAIGLGLLSEIIGVNTGLLFGNYSYDESALGLKIFGVPLLVGIMWLLVTASAWQIALMGNFNRWATVFLASWIVVIFDLLLEQYATAYGLWSWEGGQIPLLNYITWFGVSFIIFSIFALIIKKNNISKYGVMAIPVMMLYFWLMLIFT